MITRLGMFLSLITVIGVVAGSLTSASEIVAPLAQIPQGKGALSLYYAATDQKLNLRIKNKDEIKVGANSYFSEVTNDLESKGKASEVSAKFVANPWSGLYYWLKVGAGSYDLEIPSVTVNNKISTIGNGPILGIGFSMLLFPDTVVSPALLVSGGLENRTFRLERFRSGEGSPQKVSDKLDITELQISVLLSKKIAQFEPYGGLKIFRTYTALMDTNGLGRVEGIVDAAGVFLGTRIGIYPHEAIVIEGSFLGEIKVVTGWNLEF